MKTCLRFFFNLIIIAATVAALWFGPLTSPESRALGRAALRLDERLHSAQDGEKSDALQASLTFLEVEGLPDALEGRQLNLAAQLPDRLRLAAEIDGHPYQLGRNGETLWISVPHKNLAIEGSNEVPRFASDPNSTETIALPELKNPMPRWQLALIPAVFRVERETDARHDFRIRPRSFIARRIGLPEDLVIQVRTEKQGQLSEWGLTTGKTHLRVAIDSVKWLSAADAEASAWGLPQTSSDQKIDRVALSHLDRFARVALGNLNAKIPSLPPLNGSREIVANFGKGRLEKIEGTEVLFLEGTPEEMGQQHGQLMGAKIRNLVDRIVYGVGVGSSFEKGRWFFGEIEEAQSRFEPFIDERYLREMDAMAKAAGLHPQEARLSNFFPELFHCSGFALHGSATTGGRMFHGRVLDYLRGLGLEQNAVVMVIQPDEGNAWVNVSYAGFIGSVTAMNEKHLAIGEMGGRGEGNWDGKPMAQLMREVMEQADTIDEAVEIMRKGPRTCEYYYVISDAKTMRSVGIKATPDTFETIWSGESHAQLSRPVKDTVLMSAGDRYEALVDRVEANFGKFDADSARALMDKPVCMNSNIQSVLFAPDTLDFWVANADSENVASHTRYTHYNLRELLDKDSLTTASAD